MASFNVVGFNDVEKQLLLHEKKPDKLISKMIRAGAQVIISAQKESLKRYTKTDRSIGTLIESIGMTGVRRKDTQSYVEVYPMGDQPHGTPARGKSGKVRNAQVGFILEYGRSDMDERPWMAEANETSQDMVHAVMRDVWEKGD